MHSRLRAAGCALSCQLVALQVYFFAFCCVSAAITRRHRRRRLPPLLHLLLQARVLLRLNRPVDVTERGLVFVQNFLTMLAAKEAAGLLKPWFKEVNTVFIFGSVTQSVQDL